MIKLSVVIITLNEERNLDRCLSSVKNIADEIIIADSYSTDNTLAVAQKHNATVVQQAFAGYANQKNFATANATHDWILSLDADEELTPELEKSILDVKKSPAYNVYRMPRLTNYCGQWIKHCGWYPDKQTRLYNRTKGRWAQKQVHEYWQPDTAADPAGLLSGDLLHYSFNSIGEHVRKIEKYSELAAREAVANGKTAGLLKIWLSPKWHFFTEYFIKLGFLDGFNGYIICKLSAHAAFIKYSKIRIYSSNKVPDGRVQKQ